MLLLATALPNCNIQGQCGAGINSGFIALTVTDKLDIVHLNSFILDDCYSLRFSKFYENFIETDIKNILPMLRPINNQLKVDFEEAEFTEAGIFTKDVEKQVLFDMTKPEKGFIVELRK